MISSCVHSVVVALSSRSEYFKSLKIARHPSSLCWADVSTELMTTRREKKMDSENNSSWLIDLSLKLSGAQANLEEFYSQQRWAAAEDETENEQVVKNVIKFSLLFQHFVESFSQLFLLI